MESLPAEFEELVQALDAPEQEVSVGSAEGGWSTPSERDWAEAEEAAAKSAEGAPAQDAAG